MLFENLAATDDSHIIAHRKAAAVATKRVRDRFGEFLANSGDPSDRRARIALVEDEVVDIVREVVTEYGGDLDKITAAIRHSMMPGQPGPGGNPTPGMPGGAAGMAGGSATCPQCGGPMMNGVCPTCQKGGAMGGAAGAPAGAYGLTHSMPQSPSTGPVQASHEAKGGFCDDCHNWKSGPNAGCTCGSSAEASEAADSDDGAEAHEARFRQSLSIDTQPIMHAQPLPDEPGKEGVLDIDGELAKAPSAVGRGSTSATKPCGVCHGTGDCPSCKGEGCEKCGGSGTCPGCGGDTRVQAHTKEAEALKTVDLPTGNESALGGPSPKIDKGNSGDNFGWSLDPIDTQMDGSPHPTVEQDPTDKADYVNKDFLDQTDAVTKSETLPTSTNADDAGFASGGQEHGPHTDTWSGQSGQAKPVTRESLSAVDPDKNPLRELVEDYDGFLMPNQVEAAIKSWSVG